MRDSLMKASGLDPQVGPPPVPAGVLKQEALTLTLHCNDLNQSVVSAECLNTEGSVGN